MTVTITIPGVPIGQPRAKATTFGGRTRMYTPTKNGIAEYKAAVRLVAVSAWSGGEYDGAVAVDVTFVFPRQQSKVWKTRPMPRYPHTTKPDRDNLDKAILDSLKGVVYRDDAQVSVGRIEKWHAAGGESPHTEITITRLD